MGFVEGFRAAQQMKNQRAANARAEQANMRAQQQHQINMQKQQIMLQQMKQEVQFQKGRDMAVQQGGVEGLKDYLMKTRPKEGLALQKQQESLNQSIMKTMQAKQAVSSNEMSLFSQKQKILGGVYAQVMNADQKVRQQVYQDALPQIRKLDPDAPDQFDPGRAMMAIGQAIPANQLYSNQKKGLELKTDMGKAEADKQAFLQAGYSKDHPTIKALNEKINEYQQKRSELQVKNAQIQAEHLQKKEDREMKMHSNFMSASKNYREFLDVKTKADGLLSEAYGNPKKGIRPNPVSQTILATLAARMSNPGIVDKNEFARIAETDPWIKKLYNYTIKIARGDILSQSEIKEIDDSIKSMWKQADSTHQQLKSEFKRRAVKMKLDPDQVVSEFKPTAIKIKEFNEYLQKNYNGLTFEDYLAKAKKRNPNMSEDQLTKAILEKHMKGAK